MANSQSSPTVKILQESKMKKFTGHFIVDIPIFPAMVMVSIAETDDQLTSAIQAWKKLDAREKLHFVEAIETDDNDSGGVTHHLINTGMIVIRIFNRIRTHDEHGHLAHEIFHAVEKICDHAGVTHCAESSETFAYLISFITENIYRRILKP